MTEKRYLDLSDWPRFKHCEFFLGFDDPFFGLTVQLDAAQCYRNCRSRRERFFLRYLYAALQAAVAVAPLRQRLEQHGSEWRVAEYSSLTISPAIPRPDGTFGFGYFPWYPDYASFAAAAEAEISSVKQERSLVSSEKISNVIHSSVLPDVHFTAVSHPRRFNPDKERPGRQNSTPTITFGKAVREQEKLLLPVALHAHHALVDGRHAGEFYRILQEKLDEPAGR